MGLGPEQIANAIALAVPGAGGVQRAFGTDAKSLQVGFAVDTGIRAATLAAAGAQADPVALEEWMTLVGGDPGAADLSGPAVPGGLAVKIYPCCYALQRPISALGELAQSGPLDPAEVSRIVLRTPEGTLAPLIHHRPDTGLQGKFSLEYAAAAALLDGYPGFASFTDDAVRRPAARRLAGLVEIKSEPGGTWLLDGELVAELHTASGGVAQISQQFPPGSPGRPATAGQLQAKIADCLAGLDCGRPGAGSRARGPGRVPPTCSGTSANARPAAKLAGKPGGELARKPCREGTAMDELSEEERAIVGLVREFVDRDVRPVASELEHANTYPEKLIEQMKQLGIFGLAIPEPWGAARVSTPCYALVTEELARGWMSLAGAMGGHTVVAKLLLDYGTDEQKERYLPRMATGEIRATMALTEPGGGSDLQAMRTTARRDGDSYLVNGTKTWITNARRSALIALLCKTDPAARARRTPGSASCWPSTARGSRSPGTCPSSGTRGWRAASCPSTTSGCRPTRCSAAGKARGSAQMMRGLEIGRIQVASRAVGVGRAALEDALRYAQQRESVRQADLAAPVGRQLPGRHGHQADRRPPAGAVRRALLRRGRPGGHGGGHGQAVRLGDRDGDRAQRGAHPRRVRLLHRVRRGALFPGRPADDRR